MCLATLLLSAPKAVLIVPYVLMEFSINPGPIMTVLRKQVVSLMFRRHLGVRLRIPRHPRAFSQTLVQLFTFSEKIEKENVPICAYPMQLRQDASRVGHPSEH